MPWTEMLLESCWKFTEYIGKFTNQDECDPGRKWRLNYKCEMFLYPGLKAAFRTTTTTTFQAQCEKPFKRKFNSALSCKMHNRNKNFFKSLIFKMTNEISIFSVVSHRQNRDIWLSLLLLRFSEDFSTGSQTVFKSIPKSTIKFLIWTSDSRPNHKLSTFILFSSFMSTIVSFVS